MNNNSDLALGYDMLGHRFGSRQHKTSDEVATVNSNSDSALEFDTRHRPGFESRESFLILWE